eukprot:scaffold92005_cov63-Phaeocystis_antarctica.AAC.1
MRAVDQSRMYFSRRMGSRRPSCAVPWSQHLEAVGKSIFIIRNQRGEPVSGERNNRPVPETLFGQKRAYTEFRTLIEHRTELKSAFPRSYR